MEVCDNTTGRHWEQMPDSTVRTWQAAVDHCLALGAGYRLAEIKELLGLVDYGVNNQAVALNAGPFINVVGAGY